MAQNLKLRYFIKEFNSKYVGSEKYFNILYFFAFSSYIRNDGNITLNVHISLN